MLTLTRHQGPWAPASAIVEFKKQFKAKTATNWEDRVGMTVKKGNFASFYLIRVFLLTLAHHFREIYMAWSVNFTRDTLQIVVILLLQSARMRKRMMIKKKEAAGKKRLKSSQTLLLSPRYRRVTFSVYPV